MCLWMVREVNGSVMGQASVEVCDTFLAADSGDKLCRPVAVFGTVHERRKLPVKVGKVK